MAIHILVCSSPIQTLDGVNMMKEIAEWRDEFGESAIKVCFDWPDSALGDGSVDPQQAEVERIKAKYPDLATMGAPPQSFRDAVKKTKWWPKYTSKVIGGVEMAIQSTAEPSTFYMACLDGGPISQVEQYEMPLICSRVREDLRNLRRTNIQLCEVEVKVKQFERHHEIYDMLKNQQVSKQEGTYKIAVQGGTLNPRKILLSCRPDGFVDLYHYDDDSGRQQWTFVRVEGDIFNICVARGTESYAKFLSCTGDGKKVYLFPCDNGSGRQQWRIVPVYRNGKRTFYNIEVKGGVDTGRKLLNCSDDGWVMDLIHGDDGSGRQKWQLIPV